MVTTTPESEDLLQLGALYVPELGWLAQYDNYYDSFFEKNMHLFIKDIRKQQLRHTLSGGEQG